MKRLFSTLTLAIFCVMLPLATMADTVPVGDVEFNNLALGVNDFTVNNFTGANNLGFFPVADNVTFDNVVLMATESDGTVLTFDLGNLAPRTDTSAQVADSLLFLGVVFNATLNPSTFSLTNGASGTFTANPTLWFALSPSSGAYLAAGVDLGTINAFTVPEPTTISLLAFGLLGMLAVRARRNQAASRG